jgi:hypothetical protein
VDTLGDDLASAIETLEKKGPVRASERKQVKTSVTHQLRSFRSSA